VTQDQFVSAAAKALSDIALFSRLVIQVPLYKYQVRPMRAVTGSILGGYGREYLLVFPRQSGKNEAVAQLLVFLLNLLQRRGGNIVYGATGDGLGRGIQRLEKRLDNPWNRGRWRKAARPARRILGQAAVVFLSSHPSASARGETADWLLVIDEMQDQLASHLEAVFEPMRAANNATALYIGTVRSTNDALWQKKQELEQLGDLDQVQRVFAVSPEVVIKDNPNYASFLHNKVDQLGRHHPIVASEYFNEPMQSHDRLFGRRRLALMRGSHSRRQGHGETETGEHGDGGTQRRSEGFDKSPVYPLTHTLPHSHTSTALPTHTQAIHLATLDVGGQDEAATDTHARLANPGRDYTVAHVLEVEPVKEGEPGPIYRAIDVFVDQGGRHFQKAPGRVSLAERLWGWLNHWQVDHLIADESGVGAGLVDWLAAKLGREKVTGFTFTAGNKATLGNDFLSLVETGRFKYWCREELDGPHSPPLSDGWWFFQQVQSCTYSLPEGGRFERDLRWGVPDGTKIDTPQGRQPVHDDRLISAALASVYDKLIRERKVRLGRATSAIIPPRDPLQDTHF